jgi:hypothetical protein
LVVNLANIGYKISFHEGAMTWQRKVRYLAPLREIAWVVYAKEPFAGPRQVLRYPKGKKRFGE